MQRLLLVLQLTVFCSQNTFSQVFQDVALANGISSLSQASSWGNGASFYDVDQDGWDDLTICNSGASTIYFHNTQNGFEIGGIFYNTGDTKSCLWFDMEEDGDNDLLVVRGDMLAQLFRNDEANGFIDVSSNLSYTFLPPLTPWGASVVDVNRDGYLDIYICNYGISGAKNTYLQNNGQGMFTEISSMPITSKARFSFQSTWLDLNEDGFQDLYVVNDHNQGNEYYEFNPLTGVFVDKSVSSGLVAPTSAMSNSWCDYDRDGDMDMYISNTIIGNQLLQNDGSNVFTNVAPQEGVVLNKWSWSALWFDSENDGWDDLLVATNNLVYTEAENNFYFKNTQGNFSNEVCTGISNTSYEAYVYVKGDFNNDFLTDVFVNPNTNVFAKLMKNNSSISNHSIKLRFKGKWSNVNAVGTRYEFWVNGEKRIGHVLSGENYMGQNSQNIIHGLGEQTQVDSMVVFWPSGLVDRFFNLPSESLHTLVEGSSLGTFNYSKPRICPTNDSVLVNLTFPWSDFIWDNNSTAASQVFYQPQIIGATVRAPYGKIQHLSESLDSYVTPIVNVSSQAPSCKNLNNGLVSVSYSIEPNTNFQLALANEQATAGMYYYEIPFGQGCLIQDSLQLNEPESLAYSHSVVPAICPNSNTASLVLHVTGGTAPYIGFISDSLTILGLSPGVNEGVIADANGCLLPWSVNIPNIPAIQLSVDAPSLVCEYDIPVAIYSAYGGTGSLSWQGIGENGELQIGENWIQVMDANGCTHDTIVVVNAITPPDVTASSFPASILGLGEISLFVIGDFGPYNVDWNTGDTIFTLSNLPDGMYSYLLTDSLNCHYSGNVWVLYDGINDVPKESFNWFSTDSGLRYAGSTNAHAVRIYDVVGKLVYQSPVVAPGFELNTDSNGIYVVCVENKTRRIWVGR